MSDLRNVSSNPHIRAKDTTSRIMLTVVIALLLPAFFGIYNFGFRALVLILISIATCVLTEYIYEKLMKKTITIGDFSAVVTGLLLALNLPVSVPFWIPVVGGVFAILVVKMLFGGLGQNFMNPALAGRCFLLISFTSLMTNFNCDAYTGATPLASLKAGESVNVLNMILGRTAGTIGETSVIAIVLGACVLIVAGVIDLRVPGSYIASFAVFVLLFAALSGIAISPAYLSAQLAGGGLMLGAFFMATDYVTRPVTKKGQYIYGVILGFLTAIFRIFGASAEGVSYAIILGNLLVPLIERYTMPKRRRAVMKSMLKDAGILFAITLVAGLLLGCVYQITKEPIARQEALAQENACREVFSDAESFEAVTDFTEEAAQTVLNEGGYSAASVNACQEAKDASGTVLGYVLTVTTHEGYGGDIQFTVGVRNDGTLNGISLLSISETAGLGMQAGDVLVPQFADKNAYPYVYTKTGSTADNEIDAISGATITTNAVTNGVNAGVYYFQTMLQQGAGEGAANE